ncbi:MAG TPA: histidine phosphatase family protein, partial [Bacteroidales bacterium]|nr:histidine phosphatase family protein [Bacteroidales bacterium]
FNGNGVYFGRTDCPLNVEGILQGKALGHALSDIHFDEIYTSPMKRCIDTVRFITTERKPEVFDELSELDFGLWEGLNFRECRERFPEEFEKWSEDFRNTRPPQGELFTDFYCRVMTFHREVLSAKEGTILIAAHKGVLQLLASIFLTGNDSLFWNFNFLLGKYSVLEKIEEHCTITRLNV